MQGKPKTMLSSIPFSCARPAWWRGALLLLLLAVVTAPTLAQTVPAPPAAMSDVPVLSGAYVLTPGDVLDIVVQGHDDFNHLNTVIPPDGYITTTGVVGKVRAAGQTIEALEQTITHKLLRQILRPLVTVSVRETHPRQVSVQGGGVRAPGLVNWHPGMTVLDALAATGGAVQAPELTDALLIPTGGAKAVPIDLVALIEAGDQTQNVTLSPGDIVLMSPRDPAKAYVQVLGQVGRAGPVAVPPGGATLQYVLTQAGGAIPSAALSHVQVVHGKQTQTLNLHPLLFDISAPVAQTRVAAGDIVFVPLNNNHVDFYGEINAPGEMTMPDGETLTLTRAIALRSGVTHDADQRIIGIVRRDSMGREVALAVNTDDLLKARNKGQDIALLPDDRVVIPKRRQAVTGLGVLSTAVDALFGVTSIRNVFH